MGRRRSTMKFEDWLLRQASPHDVLGPVRWGVVPLPHAAPDEKGWVERSMVVATAAPAVLGAYHTVLVVAYRDEDVSMADERGVLVRRAYVATAVPYDVLLSRVSFARESLVERGLAGALLDGLDAPHALLLRADLRRAHLLCANLSGVALDEANLNDAWLAGADLSRASLRGATLAGADLHGASLARANLSDANLRTACLARTDLRGTIFTGARLEGVNLTGAQIDRHTVWRR